MPKQTKIQCFHLSFEERYLSYLTSTCFFLTLGQNEKWTLKWDAATASSSYQKAVPFQTSLVFNLAPRLLSIPLTERNGGSSLIDAKSSNDGLFQALYPVSCQYTHKWPTSHPWDSFSMPTLIKRYQTIPLVWWKRLPKKYISYLFLMLQVRQHLSKQHPKIFTAVMNTKSNEKVNLCEWRRNALVLKVGNRGLAANGSLQNRMHFLSYSHDLFTIFCVSGRWNHD